MKSKSCAFLGLLPVLVLAAASLHAGPAIPNPSFETDQFSSDVGPYVDLNTPITGWTVSSADSDYVGLNPNGSGHHDFANNGATQDGANVAFIQCRNGHAPTTLSTTITGLTAGVTYQVQFQANARFGGTPLPSYQLNGGAVVPFTVTSVDALGLFNRPYSTITARFTATATAAVLAISNNTSTDTSVLLDNFTITVATPELFVATNMNDSGPGSLRQAFMDAAALAGPDIIMVDFATGPTGTIHLASEIAVNDADGVTLIGSSFFATPEKFLDGGGTHRIFNIASGSRLSIQNLIFSGGSVTGSAPSDGAGGAIYSQGELTLSNCALTSNTSSGPGGAVACFAGSLTATNCTFSGNSATGAGSGGAISTQAPTTITRCTFSGNFAASFGGALFDAITRPVTLTLSSSTFTNNQAAKTGGAIADLDGNQSLSISQCTIAGNRCLFSGVGGGLDFSGGTIAILSDTILAGNTANGALQNCPPGPSVTIVGNHCNLSDDTPLGFTGTDIVNTDAGLRPLASNGGLTATMAIPPTSPALNAAVDSTVTTDQRGFAIVGVPDIGAYESQATTFALSSAAYTAVAGYPLTVTINRGYNLAGTATVRLLTTEDTAGAADFTTRPDTTASDVTFGNGEPTKDVVVLITKKTTPGPDKAFTVSLGSPSSLQGAAVFEPSTATVTIKTPVTLPVTTTNDDGPGSLRQALAAATGSPAYNVITFALALSGKTITLGNEIAITDTVGVTVDASGLPLGLTIDAGPGGNRIFSVAGGASLTLKRLALTGGGGNGALMPGHGGAVVVDVGGSLSMSQCSLTGNHTVTNRLGGAIYNLGALALAQCSFAGNSSDQGGAIDNHQDASLIQCTLWQNQARLTGGAIESSGSGTLVLRHCTVSGNSIVGTGGVGGGGGGGIFLYDNMPLILDNSIVFGNTGSHGNDIFDDGQVITQVGANIVGDLNNSGGGITGLGTLSQADPLLAPLAGNGGPTQTMALLGGSPAINTARGTSFATDQRGLPVLGAADIGAFEVQQGGIFTLDQPSYSVPTIGVPVTVVIRRRVAFSGPASVKISTSPGTATSAAFTSVNQVVSFADGETSKPVTIVIATDNATHANHTFTVMLSSPSTGCTLGAPATATVVLITGDGTDSTAPGAPVITSPAANALVGVPVGGTLTLTGTAMDNKEVSLVTIRDGAGTFLTNATLAAPGAASTEWTAIVTPAAGTNTYKVASSDFFMNTSPVVARTVTVLRPLVVNIYGYGTVRAGYSPSSYRQVGKPLTITATPGAGYLFTGWSILSTQTTAGIGASSLSLPTLSFLHQEGLILRATFVPSPYVATNTGVFNGGIDPSPTLPAGGTAASLSSAGYVSVTVQTSGAFTAALKLDGTSYPVTGVFDVSGTARFGPSQAAVFNIVRKNLPGLFVTLNISLGTGIISGVVSAFDGSALTAASIITAERCPFGTGNLVPASLLAAGNADALYTTILPATTNAGFATTNFPQGSGYASVKLTKAGAISVNGVLADGTPLTGATTLSGAQHWRLFASLYGNKGLVAGNVVFAAGNYDFTALGTLWLRPEMDSQYYPGGWPVGIQVNVGGAKYTVPAGASVLPGLNAHGDAEVVFSQSGLSGPLSDTFKLSSADIATNTGNDPSYKVTINRQTGMFSGFFTQSDGTKPVFNGMVLTKSITTVSAGFFLNPAPKVKDYTGQSGGVILEATP